MSSRGDPNIGEDFFQPSYPPLCDQFSREPSQRLDVQKAVDRTKGGVLVLAEGHWVFQPDGTVISVSNKTDEKKSEGIKVLQGRRVARRLNA